MDKANAAGAVINVGTTGTHGLTIWLKGQSGSWVDVRVVRVTEPEFVVFPQKTYTSAGVGSVQSDTFSVPAAGKSPQVLATINGSPDGSNRITNATVKVNTTNVLGASDFGTGKAAFRTNVSLLPSDSVVVTHQSMSGKRMKLRFTATDSTPPAVTLTQPPTADTLFTKALSVTYAGSVAGRDARVRVRAEPAELHECVDGDARVLQLLRHTSSAGALP